MCAESVVGGKNRECNLSRQCNQLGMFTYQSLDYSPFNSMECLLGLHS